MSTPQAVYIRDYNSGLVLEYKPDTPYEVVIEDRQKIPKPTQQWLVTDSGVAGCVYIQSMHDKNVITAGDASQEHLIVAPKRDGLDLNQLWILRQPDNETNAYFVLMSPKTGLVMNVAGASKDPGTYIQIYP